jgi:hypothetical protein
MIVAGCPSAGRTAQLPVGDAQATICRLQLIGAPLIPEGQLRVLQIMLIRGKPMSGATINIVVQAGFLSRIHGLRTWSGEPARIAARLAGRFGRYDSFPCRP